MTEANTLWVLKPGQRKTRALFRGYFGRRRRKYKTKPENPATWGGGEDVASPVLPFWVDFGTKQGKGGRGVCDPGKAEPEATSEVTTKRGGEAARHRAGATSPGRAAGVHSPRAWRGAWGLCRPSAPGRTTPAGAGPRCSRTGFPSRSERAARSASPPLAARRVASATLRRPPPPTPRPRARRAGAAKAGPPAAACWGRGPPKTPPSTRGNRASWARPPTSGAVPTSSGSRRGPLSALHSLVARSPSR